MKVALCFIISYDHILNKEHIWREWINENDDIINVYFYYKDYRKIKSKWIRDRCIPYNKIHETSYFHVIPAYLSIMNYAFIDDLSNQWFCLLTDSCCPIISPKRFRYLFFENHNKCIFSWKRAWWNTAFHKRANLAMLPEDYRLANDPWFTLSREYLKYIIHFVQNQRDITKMICDGGLANESLFAVIFKIYNVIESNDVICSPTHIVDWSRMTSSTSPHIFKDVNEQDIKFIDAELERNKYAMFIRKVAVDFPDDILRHYIYENSKGVDSQLIIRENNINSFIYFYLSVICILFYFMLFYVVA